MAKIISTSNIKKGFDNPFVNLSQHKSFFSIVLASLAVIMILITYSAVQQQRVYKSSAACTNPTRCNTPGEQSNCCSGYNCNPLYICASCGTQGATCALPGFISNCCSGYTCSSSRSCVRILTPTPRPPTQTPTPTCAPIGGICTIDSQCCNNNCVVEGMLQAHCRTVTTPTPTCIPNSYGCSPAGVNSKCCSNYCGSQGGGLYKCIQQPTRTPTPTCIPNSYGCSPAGVNSKCCSNYCGSQGGGLYKCIQQPTNTPIPVECILITSPNSCVAQPICVWRLPVGQ